MQLKESIYFHSPIFIQNILTTLYGRVLYQERYGSAYRNRFEELKRKERQSIDPEQEQLSRLNQFLLFCQAYSPYYKELFDRNRIELPLAQLSELKQIPLLDKETLRTRNADVHARIHAPILGKTGGTTGKSIQVHYTREDMQIRMAHLDYFKWTHGIEQGMRRASFTGQTLAAEQQKSPVYWRMNKAINQMLFSIKNINPLTIPAYIEQLNRFNPVSIDGLPSGMIEVARYAKKHAVDCTFRPKAIFPTAEMLTRDERALIEEVFHAPIFDQYASSEGAPIVAECRYGKKHLHYEMGIIEVEADGQILVTSFDTHGTPLVRYRIGDRMTLSHETCPCGHGGPIIASIDGRGRSYIQLKNGHRIFEGELAGIVRRFPNCIERVQYIQEEADEVVMLYVPDERWFKQEHEKELYFVLERLFGGQMDVLLKAVPEIPKEISGKTLLIKQLIPENERAN
ncbi:MULTISPECIES: phenylacetate--CoA ligase family protein [unclassified Exiguobacterium]|uniref:phenylacetate--CoA ligase family protein n=1 Tax=unclassified Exiguobacterium TaxID=2644629 RepID=UPI000B597217|nr:MULTISPECIES: phenylacetate--CoA ligase family protein [unclassified Exiguobacterium]ASI35537.1 CoF synthetase [Exiguobacterium sp. N4-1P]ASI37546.1 CoF synthetase [Exiguobacterium sp. N4-1P]